MVIVALPAVHDPYTPKRLHGDSPRINSKFVRRPPGPCSVWLKELRQAEICIPVDSHRLAYKGVFE